MSSIEAVAMIVVGGSVTSKNTYAKDLEVLYNNKSLSLYRVCLKCWLEKLLQILRRKNLTVSC